MRPDEAIYSLAGLVLLVRLVRWFFGIKPKRDPFAWPPQKG